MADAVPSYAWRRYQSLCLFPGGWTIGWSIGVPSTESHATISGIKVHGGAYIRRAFLP